MTDQYHDYSIISPRYMILDHLPQVPEDMIEETLAAVDEDNSQFKQYMTSSHSQSMKNYLKKHTMEEYTANGLKRIPGIDLSQRLVEWVEEHIVSKYETLRLHRSIDPGHRHPPHTDRTRSFAMIYLLESGGEDHRTVFWDAKDGRTIFERAEIWGNEDELVESDSIVIPLNTWVILDARFPHSVENIPGHRTAIQVGLETNPFLPN
jgi:hypothetical protein